MLFAIGAGSEVVGVTHECDYPLVARQRPKLTAACGTTLETPAAIDRHVRRAVHSGSSLYDLDAALLERLEPDLIVTQELCAVCTVSYDVVDAAAKRLRSDPRVVSLEPVSLDDVLANISLLAEITGHQEQARMLLVQLRRRLEVLQERTARLAGRARTLVLEWTDPPMSAGHWIPELIELAGGDPVLANPGVNSQRLDWPAIAAAAPQAVIVAPCGFDLPKTRRAIAALAAVDVWNALPACREGRVLAMDGNAYLSRPGPRLIDAAERIARWYNGDAEYAG